MSVAPTALSEPPHNRTVHNWFTLLLRSGASDPPSVALHFPFHFTHVNGPFDTAKWCRPPDRDKEWPALARWSSRSLRHRGWGEVRRGEVGNQPRSSRSWCSSLQNFKSKEYSKVGGTLQIEGFISVKLPSVSPFQHLFEGKKPSICRVLQTFIRLKVCLN